MILAGDIGATNSRLAFFTERGGRLEPVVEATYRESRPCEPGNHREDVRVSHMTCRSMSPASGSPDP